MVCATQLEASATVACLKIVIHSGRKPVLARARLLEELAGGCGQSGAMHGLSYLLDQEYTARKVPYLVCFEDDSGTLVGAVLVFEYKVYGWPTGILATGDRFGVRTVVGPESLRLQLAARACSLLLRQGAALVLVSLKYAADLPHDEPKAEERGGKRLWATQTRVVYDSLPLGGTVQETLAQLGKRTRTHLRYYQRRLEKAESCVFVPSVGDAIDSRDKLFLTELNRRSLDPMNQAAFDLQFRSALSLPGGFISGLRSGQGQWLALVGGWRQGDTTWVQWQTNAAGYEDLSVGTALRAYLIDEEVGRGSKRLSFHGGTSHSMSHAFVEDRVLDLVATRAGLAAGLVAQGTPRLYRAFPSLVERGNFVGDVLCGERLSWFTEEEITSIFNTARKELVAVG